MTGDKYLTYTEYQGLGGTLDETPFNLLEFEARREIDLRTKNRLVGKANIPNEVKVCVYNLINTISLYVSDKNRSIASETVGNYSVSYGSGANFKEVLKSKAEEIDDIVRAELYGIIFENEHLIYIGD